MDEAERCTICNLPGPLYRIVRADLSRLDNDFEITVCRSCLSAFRMRSLSDAQLQAKFSKVNHA